MPYRYINRPRPVPRVCRQCGADFLVKPARAARGEGVFCSTRCAGESRRQPLGDRFWSKVDKSGECWIWQGSRTSYGYGELNIGERNERAHRLAWTIATGEALSDDIAILHTCDNPPCVRNDDDGTYEVNEIVLPRRGHLFRGTRGVNNADRAAKGRNIPNEQHARGDRHGSRTKPDRMPRGERNGSAKLNEDDVRDIRRRSAAGETYSAIGRSLGIDHSQARNIVLRKSWAHVL